MQYNLINESNIHLLKKFIANEKSESFRYYRNRSTDVIKNHILTLILTGENQNIIGYGHLDLEERVWLGICICEEFRRKGFGKTVMNYLIEYAKEKDIGDIYLTVDRNNTVAKALYEKYDFFVEEETDELFKMVRHTK